MFKRSVTILMVAVFVVSFGFISQAISQEDRSTSGNRGQRNRDPEQAQQRMERYRQQATQRIKDSLGVTDDEWKILQPKVEKVMQLSWQTRFSMMMGGRRSSGQSNDANANQTQQKSQELKTVLENKDANNAEIKVALKNYRDARNKAKEELAKAQKELQELLTVRQEAQLVSQGLLE